MSWINHLPPACWSTFWKSNFKQQLGFRFDNLIFFVFWHMQLYMSWYIRSFFTFLNILYFSSTLVLTSSIDVVFILSNRNQLCHILSLRCWQPVGSFVFGRFVFSQQSMTYTFAYVLLARTFKLLELDALHLNERLGGVILTCAPYCLSRHCMGTLEIGTTPAVTGAGTWRVRHNVTFWYFYTYSKA